MVFRVSLLVDMPEGRVRVGWMVLGEFGKTKKMSYHI